MTRRLGIAILLLLFQVAAPARGATDGQVGKAIDRMKAFLYAKQRPSDGSWEFDFSNNPAALGGETAIATLALLVAGETPQRPELIKALDYLSRTEFKGTYATSLRAQVWAHLPDAYLPKLETDAQWLLNRGQDGLARFHYVARPPGFMAKRTDTDWDNSCTQYGVLGVWEAAKRGGRVAPEFWENVAEHFFTTQNVDGGWQYMVPDGHSTPSMTAAGLASLFIVRQQLIRDINHPAPKLNEALANGLGWFDKNFTVAGGGGFSYYYLYGVERVGLASGLRYFKGEDWYMAGADEIIAHLQENGGVGTVWETAFALLFLSRGRYPVWANKLGIRGQAWNDYPNDLESITRLISDENLNEYNWQIVDADTPAETWLDAPLLYATSDHALVLTAAQKQRVKRYLDLGGTLLVNPDRESTALITSVRALAKELYPQYPMRRLPPDHLLYQSLIKFHNASQVIYGVSNGARELILVPESDWAAAFQAQLDRGSSPPWGLATNLWAIVTDLGLIPNRLVKHFEPRGAGTPRATVRVGRATYAGNCLPEPLACEVLGNHLFNHAGVELETVDVSLEKLGDCGLPLVLLQGITPLRLNKAQQAGITAYLKAGGTLFYETVGGRGGFGGGLEEQFVSLYHVPPVPVEGTEPFITGAGLEGGQDASTVAYRRFTVLNMAPGRHPRLVTFNVGGRPAIIGSNDDLAMGVLGIRHWGLYGYVPESALKLMSNLVLWAAGPHAGAAALPAPAAGR